jgi:hypothetical protein
MEILVKMRIREISSALLPPKVAKADTYSPTDHVIAVF